jgi:hypothetical protein
MQVREVHMGVIHLRKPEENSGIGTSGGCGAANYPRKPEAPRTGKGRTMKHLCEVERVKRITVGRFSDDPRDPKDHFIVDREEVRTEPCGTPLFTDEETKRGICRSCFSGWQVGGNRPTDRGTAMIADALNKITPAEVVKTFRAAKKRVEDRRRSRRNIWDGKSAGGGTFERGE